MLKGVLIGDAMRNHVPKEIMECCQDRYDYPAFFENEIGKDFSLNSNPRILAEINNPRKVKIVLSTYRGYSIGAIHYYANIEADGIHLYEYRTGKNGKINKYYLGGFINKEFNDLPKDKQAIYDSIYKIEVGRILTKKEIDDDPIRWEGYCEGMFTNAFETKEEALDKAKVIIKTRFDNDWVVEVEDNT